MQQEHILSAMRAIKNTRTTRSAMRYHARTIWLFTRSDLKTIVGPGTFFALVVALSGPAFFSTAARPGELILSHLPRTIFWLWINLLPFSIQNQRQEESIREDLENKPWRPMPSNRLSRETARRLMWLFYFTAVLFSFSIGGLSECLTLIGLGYWYNELGGADTNCIVRNFINGCGYMCFTSGAAEVILGQPISEFNTSGRLWLLTIGIVILTTIQSQDMADQQGDSMRDRKTVPLVIGDSPARWTIAAGVALWSCLCPTFWHVSLNGFLFTAVLGAITTARFLLRRTAAADKLSFRLYNVWVISLFVLPLSRTNSNVLQVA